MKKLMMAGLLVLQSTSVLALDYSKYQQATQNADPSIVGISIEAKDVVKDLNYFKRKLSGLIESGRRAVLSQNDIQLEGVNQALRNFMVDTPDTQEGMKNLDLIARQFITEMNYDSIQPQRK